MKLYLFAPTWLSNGGPTLYKHGFGYRKSPPQSQIHKHPCGVISGPCFVQKSWFRTAQAIQNSRKMCSKNQWISDVKVLKTCVLAHSVCICWLSGFVSWAWRTHNSLVKTNVLRRHVFFASPATGFCFGGVFFSVLSERIFVQSFACSSEQVSVTRQPSPLPLPDVY